MNVKQQLMKGDGNSFLNDVEDLVAAGTGQAARMFTIEGVEVTLEARARPAPVSTAPRTVPAPTASPVEEDDDDDGDED